MKGSQKKKPKDQEKADHLAPTKVEDYHKPITAPAGKENLSRKKAQDKANVYSRAMNKKDRFFTIQKLKEKHKAEADKLNDNRRMQDVNYDLGDRTYRQRTDHGVIKNDRDWADQQKRSQEVTRYKEEYDKDGLKKTFTGKHKKLGMNHSFNHAKSHGKNKGMDKDR